MDEKQQMIMVGIMAVLMLLSGILIGYALNIQELNTAKEMYYDCAEPKWGSSSTNSLNLDVMLRPAVAGLELNNT